MAAPKTTIWDIEPHTRAKHAILERYLQAWTPILVSGGFPEVVYVDGFAGPGRYSQGEEGSPVIALRTAIESNVAAQDGVKIRFLFVEKDRQRARVLKEIVDSMDIPENFQVTIDGGEAFETAIRKLLDSYDAAGGLLPPIFAFMDPFGWTGIPFSIVRKILGCRSCEVFITFMYEEINRFIGNSDQEKNFDALFGSRDWRGCKGISGKQGRNRFLHDLYLQKLRDEARFVRSFEMRNEKDVVDYYLFYATKSDLGLKKMKAAMWKVDKTGEFRFSDATDPKQNVLFGGEPRYDVLQGQILRRFDDKEVTVAEIEEFVLVETAFRETDYKRILRQLERDGRIEVIDPPPGRKAGTYARTCMKLRFLSDSRQSSLSL